MILWSVREAEDDPDDTESFVCLMVPVLDLSSQGGLEVERVAHFPTNWQTTK